MNAESGCKQLPADRLVEALSGVFDEICVFDIDADTAAIRFSRQPGTLPVGDARPMEEMISYRCSALAAPEDEQAVRGLLSRIALRQAGTWKLKYCARAKSGHGRRIASTLLSVDGRCFLLCELDITDRREAGDVPSFARAWQEEDDYNRILMEKAGACVFDYDVAADLLHFQSHTQDRGIVRVDRPDYYNYILNNPLIHPDSRESIRRFIRETASAAPRSGSFDYISDSWGTGWRWSRMHYVSVADEQERIIHIIGRVDDIQTQYDKEQLISTLSTHLSSEDGEDFQHETIAEHIFRLLYEASDVEAAIQSILAALGKQYDVSRAYIFEDSPDHAYCTNTFEWCADGVTPEIANLQHLSYEADLAGYHENFDRRGVFFCRDIRDLSSAQYQILAPQGIHSMLQCAILDDRVFSGYIGFDECRETREWTLDQVQTLSLVSKLLGSFLMKKRRSEQAAFSSDFMAALDNNASFVYIINPETYEIVYSNKAIQERFGSTYIGKCCHREFLHQDTPCSRCPVQLLLTEGRSRALEILRPDGMWLLSQASPLHWKGLDLIMVSCTDITAQKKTSEELRLRSEENAVVAAQSGKFVTRYDLSARTFCRYFSLKEQFGIDESSAATPEASITCGLCAPDSAAIYRAFFDGIHAGKPSGSIDLRFYVKGHYRWYHGDYTLIRDAAGLPSCAVISFFDNTVQIEKEFAYHKWQNSLSKLLSDSSSYLEIDLSKDCVERAENLVRDHSVVFVGGTLDRFVSYCAIHEVCVEDCVSFRQFFSRQRLFARCGDGELVDNLEYRVRSGDGGAPRWLRANIQMVKYPYSDNVRAFIVFSDITQSRNELERLSQLALHDSLTGLLNHDATEKQVTAVLDTAAPGDAFALFMLDLDNFKLVNDRLGHQEGDRILTRVAESISRLFRADDIVGRIGGDEFMAFMSSGAEPEVVRQKAAALTDALQFGLNGVSLSASVGAVVTRGDSASFDRLYSLADKALYSAKNAGKNCCRVIDESDDSAIQKLPASEAIQLHTLLEYMEGGVILAEISSSVEVFYTSPSLLRMSGLEGAPEDALCGQKLFSMVHPDDLPELLTALREGTAARTVVSRTFRLVPEYGGWWHLRGAPLPGLHNGNPIFICVVTDVTQLKRSEEQVRFAEERYRIAVLQTGALLWEVDIPGRTLHQSLTTSLAFGHRGEVYRNVPDGLLATGTIHPDSVAEYRRMYDDLYAGIEGHEYLIQSKNGDGGYIWVRARFALLRREDGTPYYSVSIAVPIRNIDANLQRFMREVQFSSLIDRSLLGILRINLTRRQVEYARLPEDLSGTAHSPVTYEDLLSLQHESQGSDDIGSTLPQLFSAYSSGKRWILTDYLRHSATGEDRWVSRAIQLRRQPVSGDLYAFVYLRDTDLRHHRESLLSQPACRDSATLLYTRETTQALIRSVLRSVPGDSLVSLALVSITGFERLKREQGIEEANSVLFTVGRLCRNLLDGSTLSGHFDETQIAVFRAEAESEDAVRQKAVLSLKQMRSILHDIFPDAKVDLTLGIATEKASAAQLETLLLAASQPSASLSPLPEIP